MKLANKNSVYKNMLRHFRLYILECYCARHTRKQTTTFLNRAFYENKQFLIILHNN